MSEFKCPKCSGSSIEVIQNGANVRMSVSLDTDGELSYDETEVTDAIDSYFQCAKCGKYITSSEDDILELLKGES